MHGAESVKKLSQNNENLSVAANKSDVTGSDLTGEFLLKCTA